ncbi:SH3 domain-containing protein [Pseudahrensia aquimaris]|uniref:SH3 domain-containing protein n=1 Tax=Pseudahrensia aquimaris TaxID=744461 RepID=A0ABW3FMM5_9HYPH
MKHFVIILSVIGSFMLGPQQAYAAWNARAVADVNMRAGPGVRYRILDVIPAGRRVSVRRCIRSWCRVRFRGLNGWVSRRFLRPSRVRRGYRRYRDPYYEDPYWDGPSIYIRPRIRRPRYRRPRYSSPRYRGPRYRRPGVIRRPKADRPRIRRPRRADRPRIRRPRRADRPRIRRQRRARPRGVRPGDGPVGRPRNIRRP